MMMIFILILQLTSANFEDWYKKFSKHMTMYGISKEESRRAYIENEKFVNDFNKQGHSYTLSMTGRWSGFPKSKLSTIFKSRRIPDYTNHTLKGDVNVGCAVYYKTNKEVPVKQKSRALPDSIDWRSSMSPVRDQGGCGSCYTFGSIGALEGRLNIMYNTKLDLSEQQVIDCSSDYGNHGCDGGIGEKVYNYLVAGNLVAYEYDYPYKSSTGTCKTDVPKHAKLLSYTCGLDHMQEHLVNGPIDIAMYVSGSFMNYASGYYDGSGDGCTNDYHQANHEMLAVGYGYNEGKLYYIVRNSWGTSWGIDGYIYVYDNVCSLTKDPEVPLAYELR